MDTTSPYWDGDPDYYWEPAIGEMIQELGNGWMTRIHCQKGDTCQKGCFLFGMVNAVESRMNLYYNQHLYFNLSEQEPMSCYPYFIGNCYSGGFTSSTLKYVRDSGVVNENCFPYINDTCNCSEKCPNPEQKVKIGGYQIYYYANDIDSLRKQVIEKGPMTFSYDGHATCLVGYGTIYPNMILDADNDHGSSIIINEESPFIGKNYWILKNSRSWVDAHNGYVYGLHEGPISSVFLKNTIQDLLNT